jgi:hypothetical protein
MSGADQSKARKHGTILHEHTDYPSPTTPGPRATLAFGIMCGRSQSITSARERLVTHQQFACRQMFRVHSMMIDKLKIDPEGPGKCCPKAGNAVIMPHESPRIRRLGSRHIYAPSGREHSFYFHFKRAIRSSLRTLEALLARCLRVAQAGNRSSSIRNKSTSVLLVGLVPRVRIHRPRRDDRGGV